MFPADCVRMRGFRKRVLDFVVVLRWISIISFRSVEVDFVAEGGFRFIDTGFRKFWWISWISWISIFRPTTSSHFTDYVTALQTNLGD